MRRISRGSAVLISALLGSCGGDAAAPGDPPMHLVTIGTVRTADGPVSGGVVRVRIRDEAIPNFEESIVAEDSVASDIAGAFRIALPLAPASSTSSLVVDLTARAALGSGLSLGTHYGQPVFLSSLQSEDTVHASFVLVRQTDPIPSGPVVALTSTMLHREAYVGQTVPPELLGFTSLLGLHIDSVTDAIHGRWHLSYSATTVGGFGPLRGQIVRDTFRAVLTDTSNVAGGNCGGTLELAATATSAAGDSLVGWLRRGTATQCHVDAAPLLLPRVPEEAFY